MATFQGLTLLTTNQDIDAAAKHMTISLWGVSYKAIDSDDLLINACPRGDCIESVKPICISTTAKAGAKPEPKRCARPAR
jgi:hypothetical protein